MAKYNFHIPTLIECVKVRPCLWDKTNQGMRDRFQRNRAWQEISELMQDNYEKLSNDDQKELTVAVIKKWHHVRDAFIKSVKKRVSNPESKEYVHHHRLQFLLKVIDGIEPRSADDNNVETTTTTTAVSNQEDESTLLALRRPSDIKRSASENGDLEDDDCDSKSDISLIDVIEIEPPTKVRKLDEDVTSNLNTSERELSRKFTTDEDEAFFFSITSLVKGFSEDQKIDFKIGVLNLIKHIRNNS